MSDKAKDYRVDSISGTSLKQSNFWTHSKYLSLYPQKGVSHSFNPHPRSVLLQERPITESHTGQKNYAIQPKWDIYNTTPISKALNTDEEVWAWQIV